MQKKKDDDDSFDSGASDDEFGPPVSVPTRQKNERRAASQVNENCY